MEEVSETLQGDVGMQLNLYKVFVAPDTPGLTLNEVARQLPESDRENWIVQAIAIAHHFQDNPATLEVFSTQIGSLFYLASLWEWPPQRLPQLLAQWPTRMQSLEVLSQQNTPLARSLRDYLAPTTSDIPEANPSSDRSSEAISDEKGKGEIDRDATSSSPNRQSPPPEARREDTQTPLLEDPRYAEAIASSDTLANVDYECAHRVVSSAIAQFNKLKSSFTHRRRALPSRSQSKAQNAALEPLEELYGWVRQVAEIYLTTLQDTLEAKQRSLGHFTIAIMGRTKAGKSTLFATLLDRDYDGIGDGQQRKTRQNRRYDLSNNLRLIDTPGIAAVGGELDEIEASKAVEEANLICYIVTSDSIQESEFEFLKKLKNKTKPLLILLNVQYNLQNEKRLNIFIKNPQKRMSNEEIEGHKTRITEYADRHYTGELIEVLPVMLLAAQLSRQKENAELCDRLYRASQIRDFLEWIENKIINESALLISQTLLGETATSLKAFDRDISKRHNNLKEERKKINRKYQELQVKIEKIRKKTIQNFEIEILDMFQTVINQIPEFARRNWEKDKKSQENAWEHFLKSDVKLREKLKNITESLESQYKREIQNAIEEIIYDLKFFTGFGDSGFRFEGVGVGFDFQFAFKAGAALLGIAGVVAAIVGGGLFPPILAGGAIVAGILGSLSKSKAQRQREACQKIESELKASLQAHQKKILRDYQKTFDKEHEKIVSLVRDYFEQTISELDSVLQALEETEEKLKNAQNQLTGFFALRVVDYCYDRQGELTESRLSKTIYHVRRKPGEYFEIQLTKSQPPVSQIKRNCSHILGENVIISR
ncbi:GTPase [Baaleninema simplex]|uniref:GTPase n=1 Tax=Baaleninema simplex TaxID=2862350 RepID=UPI00130EB485|nr:GTPase domain-containing protein [Baaleninema simplex]